MEKIEYGRMANGKVPKELAEFRVMKSKRDTLLRKLATKVSDSEEDDDDLVAALVDLAKPKARKKRESRESQKALKSKNSE